jgi:hypothetical protein
LVKLQVLFWLRLSPNRLAEISKPHAPPPEMRNRRTARKAFTTACTITSQALAKRNTGGAQDRHKMTVASITRAALLTDLRLDPVDTPVACFGLAKSVNPSC